MAKYHRGLMEIIVDPALIEKYADTDLMGYYCDMRTPEKIAILRESLIQEIHAIINSDKFTDKQKDILKLYFQGMTQEEIGAELGIRQEHISITLNGCPIYKGNRKTGHLAGRTYGGIIKKLKKLCGSNDKIQDILKEIREHRDLD